MAYFCGMPDTTWEPFGAELEGGVAVFLLRDGNSNVQTDGQKNGQTNRLIGGQTNKCLDMQLTCKK